MYVKNSTFSQFSHFFFRVLRPGGHLELIERELQVYNAGPHFAFMIKNSKYIISIII
jgi:hypothetical protein